MITLDASVAVKWFKPHERFEAEAQALLDLVGGFKVEALASEWLSLEVVRGWPSIVCPSAEVCLSLWCSGHQSGRNEGEAQGIAAVVLRNWPPLTSTKSVRRE